MILWGKTLSSVLKPAVNFKSTSVTQLIKNSRISLITVTFRKVKRMLTSGSYCNVSFLQGIRHSFECK